MIKPLKFRSRFYFSQRSSQLCNVTLGNVACNLSRNGATKFRDKLQEKLPSVTAPLDTSTSTYTLAAGTLSIPVSSVSCE